MPTAVNTLGCTMPQPPSSSQPDLEQVRQPEPSQIGQVMSNSADGSVNGKYDGRSREWIARPKYAVVNASIVPARSPKVMPVVDDEPLDLVEHRHVAWRRRCPAGSTGPGMTE